MILKGIVNPERQREELTEGNFPMIGLICLTVKVSSMVSEKQSSD